VIPGTVLSRAYPFDRASPSQGFHFLVELRISYLLLRLTVVPVKRRIAGGAPRWWGVSCSGSEGTHAHMCSPDSAVRTCRKRIPWTFKNVP
jgi:hypothetical protein